MRMILLTVLVVLAVSGCAKTQVVKIPLATGGSKADGTVRMAYEVRANEQATVNWSHANVNALKRCEAWGYTKVDQFAGVMRHCQEMGQGLLINGAIPGDCAQEIVYKDFQCID